MNFRLLKELSWSKAGVPDLSLPMYPFNISTYEGAPQKFSYEKMVE